MYLLIDHTPGVEEDMKIKILETGKIEELSITDASNGQDYIQDFIGNTGALSDGQFELQDEGDLYLCSKDCFKWWEDVVSQNQKLNFRIFELGKTHGYQKVEGVMLDAMIAEDMEYYAAAANDALDRVFGVI